jgi:hypothetical protein
MGVSSTGFRKKKEGYSAFLTSAVFQVPLTKSSQYVRVTDFGIVCSKLLLSLRHMFLCVDHSFSFVSITEWFSLVEIFLFWSVTYLRQGLWSKFIL